ncbi:MAG: hypothetical protein ACRDNI_00315 [Gaiellaceae bacterium]
MADEATPSRHWWQTLPGALTAIAGLITAITGLVIALNQLGVFGDEEDAASPAAVVTSSDPPATGGEPADYAVSFPQGTAVTIGEAVYDIRESRVTQRNPGELALALTVRMTNGDAAPANFWSATFRLLVDDVPRAPVDDLNEVVDTNSSAEGAVTFAVPAAPGNFVLQFSHAGQQARLPLELRETAR